MEDKKQLRIWCPDEEGEKYVDIVEKQYLHVWQDGRITRKVGCHELPASLFIDAPFGKCYENRVPMYRWEIGGVWCGIDAEGHIYDDIGRLLGEKTKLDEDFELEDYARHYICCFVKGWVEKTRDIWDENGDCMGSVIEGVPVEMVDDFDNDNFTIFTVYEDRKIYIDNRWIGYASKLWMEESFVEYIVSGLEDNGFDHTFVCRTIAPHAHFLYKSCGYDYFHVELGNVICGNCASLLNASLKPYFRDTSSFLSLDGKAKHCWKCGCQIDWKNTVWIDETKQKED